MHVNFLGPPLHDNKEKLLKYFLMETTTNSYSGHPPRDAESMISEIAVVILPSSTI